MSTAYQRIREEMRQRQLARLRPFPQFRIRTILLLTTVVAVGMTLVICYPGSFGHNEQAFFAAGGLGIAISFLLAAISQNRIVFVTGSIGSLIGVMSLTGICRLPGHPLLSWSARFCHEFLPLCKGMLAGTCCGCCVGALLVWLARKQLPVDKSKARLRRAILPKNVGLSESLNP